MYLRIVRNPHDIPEVGPSLPFPEETLIECKKFDILNLGTSMVQFDCEHMDGTETVYDVPKEPGYDVYVMSNEGKTIDHYAWD